MIESILEGERIIYLCAIVIGLMGMAYVVFELLSLPKIEKEQPNVE